MTPGYVDGNGSLDLIATRDESGATILNQIALRSDGGADFSLAHELPGLRLEDPFDFDGDRRSELALVLGNDLVVHENDSMGGWAETQRVADVFTCQPDIDGGAWGDVTGDGSANLVVVAPCEDGTGHLIVFAQDEGSLTVTSEHAIDGQPQVVTLADFDNDGILDALTSTVRFDQDLPLLGGQVLRGGGDGTFSEVLLDLAHAEWAFGSLDIIAADIDGDGVPEAIPTNWDAEAFGLDFGEQFLVTLGDGIRIDSIPVDERFADAADINGDGCDDLVTRGELTTLLMPCD